MIGFIITAVETVICYLLQTSLFSYFRIAGTVPDCLFILVIFIAYTYGQKRAVVTGFFAGLLLDILSSDIIGLSAVIYMILGFCAGYANKIYDRHDFITPNVLVFFGEFLFNLMYYIMTFLLMGKSDIGVYFIGTMLPKIIYTLVVSIALYPLLYFGSRLTERFEGLNGNGT